MRVNQGGNTMLTSSLFHLILLMLLAMDTVSGFSCLKMENLSCNISTAQPDDRSESDYRSPSLVFLCSYLWKVACLNLWTVPNECNVTNISSQYFVTPDSFGTGVSSEEALYTCNCFQCTVEEIGKVIGKTNP